MGACSCTLKSCIVFMSFLLWVATAGLLFVGIKVYVTYPVIQELGKSVHVLVPAAIIIASAVFIFFVGLVGCFAAFKDQKGVRAAFFVFLFLIFIGEVVGAALSVHYQDQIKQEATTKLDAMIEGYAGEEKKEIDYIQNMLGCCGTNSYTDWWNSTGSNDTVPQSCCQKANCSVPVKDTPSNGTLFEKGCINLLDHQLRQYFWYIAGSALGFATVQILGLIATLILVCREKKQTYTQLSGYSSYK